MNDLSNENYLLNCGYCGKEFEDSSDLQNCSHCGNGLVFPKTGW